MPLSEDEQRILNQIEQQFYDTDPAFARGVSQKTLYNHAFRNLKWATLGFIAGLVFLRFTLSTSYVLSFAGFLGMLAAAFVFERNARKLGRAGLQQVTQSLRGGGGVRGALGSAGERLRGRMRRRSGE
jgi:hypothetical protein